MTKHQNDPKLKMTLSGQNSKTAKICQMTQNGPNFLITPKWSMLHKFENDENNQKCQITEKCQNS